MILEFGTIDALRAPILAEVEQSSAEPVPRRERYDFRLVVIQAVLGFDCFFENPDRGIGVAIRGRGLVAGSRHALEIHLDRQHVTLTVEILDDSGDDLIHARFTRLTPAAQRLIDDYIEELSRPAGKRQFLR